ncbi:MAG: RNA polymerase sigma factor [Candidatus Omnitrophica bacterium]|nr:RNA polymerase sigma factor [Candidatus Omnitrophota bacterium]
MVELTDNELIEQAKGGDQYAFSVLYGRYEERIFNYAARLVGGDTHRAEEVVQNTFLIVYRHLHKYRPGESARPWIYGIAGNVARRFYKRKQREAMDVSIDEERGEGETPLKEFLKTKELSPVEALRTKEFYEHIQKAIDSLPEIYREALVLHDLEEVPYEEIQRILGVPYKTAARRVAVGRLLFRKKVDPGKFGLELFFLITGWKMIAGKLEQLFEKWRLDESTLALLADHELSETREALVSRLVRESEPLTRSLRAMEEAKILLGDAPRLRPATQLKVDVLRLIGEEPLPAAPWFAPALNIFTAMIESIRILPRAALSGMLVAVLTVSIGTYTFYIEGARTLRVEEVRGAPEQEGALLSKGKSIRLGEPIETHSNEELLLRRKSLFTLEVKEKTALTVERISRLGGIGRNEVAFQKGNFFFKSEEKLRIGDFLVNTPWFRITHRGTVASFSLSLTELRVAVLSGKIELDPLPEIRPFVPKNVLVSEGEEFIFNRESLKVVHRRIEKESVAALSEFSATQEIVLLGLAPKGKAKSLVGKSQKIAFSFVNIAEPQREKELKEIDRLFETPGPDVEASLLRIAQLLNELTTHYEQKGQIELAAKLTLIQAAVYDNLGNDESALVHLNSVAEKRELDPELRALALCAMGIIYEERLNDPIRARERYESALGFKDTTVAEEASERLNK